MRKCAVEQGLADLELEFHVLAGKMHPATVPCPQPLWFVCISGMVSRVLFLDADSAVR